MNCRPPAFRALGGIDRPEPFSEETLQRWPESPTLPEGKWPGCCRKVPNEVSSDIQLAVLSYALAKRNGRGGRSSPSGAVHQC
jgi:hypothetical protein